MTRSGGVAPECGGSALHFSSPGTPGEVGRGHCRMGIVREEPPPPEYPTFCMIRLTLGAKRSSSSELPWCSSTEASHGRRTVEATVSIDSGGGQSPFWQKRRSFLRCLDSAGLFLGGAA